MAALTQKQLTAVEIHNGYRDQLRMAVIAQAAFQHAAAPAATEAWFRNRQTAEIILANPVESIDRSYWSARSLGTLKNMDIANVDENSTADAIVNEITLGQWETLAVNTFAMETQKVLFT